MTGTEETAERALARQKAWATGLVVLCALVLVAARALEARYAALAWVAAHAFGAAATAIRDRGDFSALAVRPPLDEWLR